MKRSYEEFLASKHPDAKPAGFEPTEPINPKLFLWQQDVVRWALRLGKAALFEECGLGKTAQQLEWARHVHGHTGGNVLILAPLAVAPQTRREGEKFGIPVTVCRTQSDVQPGVNVTNYEMLKHFDADAFKGVVLDESGILKSFMGQTKQAIIRAFRKTPFKLACTATPAPNDHMELGNHADFLDVLASNEMLARWFINDTMQAGNYRLKGYAEADFWRWVASWAVSLSKPSDLGYPDNGFDLPPLNVVSQVVEVNLSENANGFLFRMPELSATSIHTEMRLTAQARAARVGELVNGNDRTWVVWCNTDYEDDALRLALPDAVSLRGSDSVKAKTKKLEDFSDGKIRVLISKPKLAGFGLNWQHASDMAFVGLSYCFDAKTEILTRSGWLTFDRVTTKDDVATINPETRHFEWQSPSRVTWNDYDGEMIHFRARSMDLLVTPNHRMWVKRCGIRYQSGDVDRWHIQTADDLALWYRRQEYRMATTADGWDGFSPEYVEIPADPDVDYTRANTRRIGRIPIDVFASLAGWYLSEGCVRTNRGYIDGTIVICQSFIHPENRDTIISTLKSIGIPVHSETKDIRIQSRELALFLDKQFGLRSNNKRVPYWAKSWKTEHLRILWDAIMAGDGMHNHGVLRGLKSISPQLIDDCQEIGIKLGISTTNRSAEWDTLAIRGVNREPSICKRPERIQYQGKIGCVTVPNGLIVVRRNGHAVVSGNSYEQMYQAIRRCWRFGQKNPVDVHVVLAETEGPVLRTIETKQRGHEAMKHAMVAAMSKTGLRAGSDGRGLAKVKESIQQGKGWKMHLGDNCKTTKFDVGTGTVGLTVSSLPFENLYIYSDVEADIGNSKDSAEFFEHMGYLIPELLRVTIPGRLCVMHCKHLPLYRGRDGEAGVRDFPGEIIRAFVAGGWTLHSPPVTIWKDPVTEMQRTKNHGLLYKVLCRDSSASRVGMPDYLLIFRKSGSSLISDSPVCNGTNPERFDRYVGLEPPDPNLVRTARRLHDEEGSPEPSMFDHYIAPDANGRWPNINPFTPGSEDFRLWSIAVWQKYASPVWFDINQMDVLQYRQVRDEHDERHICLANGSLVLTRDGHKPIEEVEVGDMVLTHRGRWRPVTATACNGLKPVVRVEAQGVACLRVTPEHLLWARTSTGSGRWPGEKGGTTHPRATAMRSDPEWMEAADTLGSYVNLKLPPIENSPYSAEDWWIVGRWLGDGYRDARGHILITSGHHETANLRAKLGGRAGATTVYRTADHTRIGDADRRLRPLLDRFGNGVANKRLPVEALSLEPVKAEALLSGYLSADGHYVARHYRWTASSVSRPLLLGMAMVAQRACGVAASVYAGRKAGTCVIEGRTVNTRDDWILGIPPRNLSGFLSDDGSWKKVRQVKSDGCETVWDIQVAEDHSFTAEGCIVHNCPLQLDVIERCVHLWSNPGDLVLDPFAGIGSTPKVAIDCGRRALGIELKPSYWRQAVMNCKAAVKAAAEPDLFAAETAELSTVQP